MSNRDETEPSPAWRPPGWECNIYEHMEAIRTHLQFWIGERSIPNLTMYLTGYENALRVHRIEERDCPPSRLFMCWLERTGSHGCEQSMDNFFLQAADGDNELALENFFRLFAEFGKLRVAPGEFVDLPDGHKRKTELEFLNRQPVPRRIQLGYLQPGGWCFVKEWIAGRVQYTFYLYDDGRAAKHALESEFGVTPDMWSAGYEA